ncbi:DUF2510 domain-containing protein [[Arthrobacter] sp. ATCC 21022]|uniref:DUF2510 domain-containing protein n=1 Tax=Paenarthrobacter TaxID=1742992 RepID=UPI0009E89E77|nr:DUF2510 domain-containing protein [Paenarthrobacter ureafaciens]
MSVPAGWYTDPQEASLVRYWDGRRWTQHVQPAQQQQLVQPQPTVPQVPVPVQQAPQQPSVEQPGPEPVRKVGFFGARKTAGSRTKNSACGVPINEESLVTAFRGCSGMRCFCWCSSLR